MNGLRNMLNDRKRFVCSAALAAVFILLAGGANALAITYTVWCVPNASVNPACTSGAGQSHIQDAVSAANPGDVIVVGPGKYNESVYIGTANLSIFGAQAGKDARVDRHDPSKESIVDASPGGTRYGSGGGAAFNVYGSNVLIDGFTIQGGTAGSYGSGIFVWGYYSYPPTYSTYTYSTQILNNIIQNNAVGVHLYYSYYTLIEYNLFKSNNTGSTGSGDSFFEEVSGVGIGGAPYLGVAITENAFTGNLGAAMWLYDASYAAITKNTSEKDGSFVVFYYCFYSSFTQNQGQDFGAKGVRQVFDVAADAAIDIVSYNEDLQITDNDLEEGKTPGYNGIAFSTMFEFYDLADNTICEYCQVSNNTIKRFAGSGIVAEPAPTDYATVYYSGISGNDVEDNGNDGILIGAGTLNSYNSLVDNHAEGNHPNDCEDDTAPEGSLTAETNNTWFNNIGSSSSPGGLCTYGGWHVRH